MPTLHMMIGIQGSGKSTLAKNLQESLQAVIISTDYIRKTYPNITENNVLPTAYELCVKHLSSNDDVIYDATNITPKVRKRLIDFIKQSSSVTFDVVAHFLPTSLKVCKERVKVRNEDPNSLYLPLEVIDNYFGRLIPPSLEEDFVYIKKYNDDGQLVETIKKN